MIARALLGLALLAAPAAARAESLVSALSDEAVEINSSFTGSRIVVFGAIEHAPADSDDYEVAIVVSGPPQDIVARQKGRVFGVWANRDTREFDDVPSYYVVHFSENLSRQASLERLEQYRLGIDNLPFVRESAGNAVTADFAEAVVRIKNGRGLYMERPNAVEFLGSHVFRTTFFLPANVPTGQYTVAVYVFRNETFLAGQTQSLIVEKSGTNDEIARFSENQPLVYGLATVALSLFTGWLGGVVFRRG
ncbi:TIGR02186 family protein [Propylenella binzhouense]|uniref:TIGR02186 family protein n=1 Tax=Propylenella binzhouense TaxID=2555902 RepID=A0A964WVY1_9HYPH|nr:TIGR02186 family protein [Propylenella binzhouense]MYZ50300.1 hypothetical protein [Propylenella binzhouense]